MAGIRTIAVLAAFAVPILAGDNPPDNGNPRFHLPVLPLQSPPPPSPPADSDLERGT